MARAQRVVVAVLVAFCVARGGVAAADRGAVQAEKPKAQAEKPKPQAKRTTPLPKRQSLTSATWQPTSPPPDLHWHLLALPEYLVELVVSPLALLITLTERYRLDHRLRDALRNDAKTIGVTPRVKLSTGNGLGAGASLWFDNLFGDERRLRFGALGRTNGDFEFDAIYRSSYASMEGRSVTLRVLTERDKNLPYFGIGGDTTMADRRVLQTDRVEAGMSIDLFGTGILGVGGAVDLSVYRERLGTGTHPTVMGVTSADSVAPPPAFGDARNYGQLDVAFEFDNRDTIGRPTKGVNASVVGSFASDTEAEFAAVAIATSATVYLPLLPEHRVVALTIGGRASAPLFDSDDVPLALLTTLGRRDQLRGYFDGRFRDRLGWWASAEYAYPIYEYMATGVQLHALFFGELGAVGRRFSELVDSAPHYSWGFGLRGVHDAIKAISLVVGFSPDGAQFGFAAGSSL